VRPPAMVVAEVVPEDPPEMPLAEHDRMIQALTPDGADQPLDEGALLWRHGGHDDEVGRHDVLDVVPEEGAPGS
jgi:hypothetical protein